MDTRQRGLAVLRERMKILALALISGIALFISGSIEADVFTFQPEPGKLNNLDHNKYYEWIIGWSMPSGHSITSAVLSFSQIYDASGDPDNILYMHLLKSSLPVNSNYYNVWVDHQEEWDNPDYHTYKDAFDGQGAFIAKWSDPDPDLEKHDKYNPAYDFGILGLIDDLETYSANGAFGFGFDPDCVYNFLDPNDGITFTITTSPIPEPGVLALIGTGLAGLVGYSKLCRRRK